MGWAEGFKKTKTKGMGWMKLTHGKSNDDNVQI